MSTVLTSAEVAEIRARAENATPGVWKQDFDEGKPTTWVVLNDQDGIAECLDGPHDAAFVAAAHADVPALCDSHDALERDNKRLKAERNNAQHEANRAWGQNYSLNAVNAMMSGVRTEIEKERDEAWQRISDLTAQLAQRDKAIAEALKQLECAPHDSDPDRYGDPSCASLRDRGRFRGPCNCGVSDVVAALTSTTAAPVPDFDPAAPKGAKSIP